MEMGVLWHRLPWSLQMEPVPVTRVVAEGGMCQMSDPKHCKVIHTPFNPTGPAFCHSSNRKEAGR